MKVLFKETRSVDLHIEDAVTINKIPSTARLSLITNVPTIPANMFVNIGIEPTEYEYDTEEDEEHDDNARVPAGAICDGLQFGLDRLESVSFLVFLLRALKREVAYGTLHVYKVCTSTFTPAIQDKEMSVQLRTGGVLVRIMDLNSYVTFGFMIKFDSPKFESVVTRVQSCLDSLPYNGL